VKLICVGGTSSGSGKTSVVTLLLQALPGWAAIKVTPSRPDESCPHGRDCAACSPPDDGCQVVIGSAVLSKFGKDTERFQRIAPSRVAWVRALPEQIPRGLASALALFPDAPGAIIESTTAMPMVDGLRILVAREPLTDVKDSARRCANLVDLLAVNVDVQRVGDTTVSAELRELAPRARIFRICAVLAPDDARNREFIAAVRLAAIDQAA
jgi:hypothetical protein